MYLYIGFILASIVVFSGLSVLIVESFYKTKDHINDVGYKPHLRSIHDWVSKAWPDIYDFSDVVLQYILGTFITAIVMLLAWPAIVIFIAFSSTVEHLRQIKRLKKELSDKDC